MQDDGQAVFLREFELRGVKPPLPLAHMGRAQLGHKKVQPDLTHSHEARVITPLSQGVVQRQQVRFLRLGHIQWVDAQSVRVAMLLGQLRDLGPVGGVHRRDHAVRHACDAGCLAQRIAVGVKLGRVQVAVRVDPHPVKQVLATRP